MARKITGEFHRVTEIGSEQKTWAIPTKNGMLREGKGEMPESMTKDFKNGDSPFILVLIVIAICSLALFAVATSKGQDNHPYAIPESGSRAPFIPPSGSLPPRIPQ